MWGLEPQTFCMLSGRSTTELHPLFISYFAPVINFLKILLLVQKIEMWGIEPQTFFMQSGRSTTELHPLFISSIAPVDICK